MRLEFRRDSLRRGVRREEDGTADIDTKHDSEDHVCDDSILS